MRWDAVGIVCGGEPSSCQGHATGIEAFSARPGRNPHAAPAPARTPADGRARPVFEHPAAATAAGLWPAISSVTCRYRWESRDTRVRQPSSDATDFGRRASAQDGRGPSTGL
ncbi:hypothetical protein GCM10010219_54770 [Streptomyces netropsis]|nr:hypothetical protein GCM10010219_54770 [Streptomyces netropsis]